MALPKQVKKGGSYYKGFKLTVSSTAGDYVLTMTAPSSTACAVNGLLVICDQAGSGDTYKLEHQNSGGTVIETLAEDIHNVGKNVAQQFDFSAAELMDSGDKMILTYTNAATIAMNVYTIMEAIK